MKSQALIINAARGGIINENDLYVALKQGLVAGAALDVFEREPVNMNNPLLSLDTVIVSPHNAGSSSEGKNRVVQAAVQNVIDIAEGKIPEGVLNPEVLSRRRSALA
jgi:phosphoglycerate dehydrogenase-like enzyme